MIPGVYAGARRHRVAIERKVAAADAGGGVALTWQQVARPWARIRPISARERLQAQQLQATVTHRALIPFFRDAANREMPGVTAGDRLVYKGTAHDIQAVIDLEERRRWLELELQSGVAA